jgi:hypothetical protein
LAHKVQRTYEIELETVINDELKPKKEGISMGETIEMINKHSKGILFGCGTPNVQFVTCQI